MTAVRADELLDDLAGRIEYSFYAADDRGLQQSWQDLDKLQVQPADSDMRDTYLNYGLWKVAQLLAVADPDQAQQFAETCAESRAATRDARATAIHYALVAACYGMLERSRPVRGLLYRNHREAALSRALNAGADVPQVLLIAGWLGVQQGDADQARALLTRALSRFSAMPSAGPVAARSRSYDWGYAETCYLLGKLELERGDALAARNALEQALVQAPDYRDAHLLLQSLKLN